ncbi:GNAT family N-acetyltransferase [Kitasatospora terrestris]|uniref:GNAT family N-acetyltransferase n=1 Tax=Kitasatospora terrestris TaxID=258051 RepID=A0ABP9DQD8_9ACTN
MNDHRNEHQDGAAELLAAYDAQLRGVDPDPPAGIEHQQDGPVTRVVGQFRGFVAAPADLGVDGADLDALIARQRDFFAARGEAVEWKTRGHDRPAGLPGRLAAAGFVPEDPETVLIGRVEELAGEPVLPEGVVLRETSDPEDLRRIAALESEIWGFDMSWLGEELIARTAASSAAFQVLVAEADGRPVSAAWLALRPGSEFGGLWGGSTLEAWRGRGIYRALVAARATRARSLGYRYLQVDASDDSLPILRRLGMVPVTSTTPYVWTPPAA